MPSVIILLINTVSLRFPSLSGFWRSRDAVLGEQRAAALSSYFSSISTTGCKPLPVLAAAAPRSPPTRGGASSPLKSSFSFVNGGKFIYRGFGGEYSARNIPCKRRCSPGARSQPSPTRNPAPSPGPALQTPDPPTRWVNHPSKPRRRERRLGVTTAEPQQALLPLLGAFEASAAAR